VLDSLTASVVDSEGCRLFVLVPAKPVWVVKAAAGNAGFSIVSVLLHRQLEIAFN